MGMRVLTAVLSIAFLAGCTKTAAVDVWVSKSDGTPYAGVDVNLDKARMIFGNYPEGGRTDPSGYVRLEPAVTNGLTLWVRDRSIDRTWGYPRIPHPALGAPLQTVELSPAPQTDERLRVRVERAISDKGRSGH
jgi:hypothetical protein